VRFQKLMWHNIMRSTKSQKVSVLHYSIDIDYLRNTCVDKWTKFAFKFGGILLQPTVWRLIRLFMCTFSHMTHFMSHINCLKNIHE
jgi:hypothetical protein